MFDGNPWVSLVAFTMEKIRPRGLPYFPPVSCFDEINIRTYVTYKNKAGVYFLSIEGGTRVSCQIARSLSELPYRYSNMKREENLYHSQNRALKSSLELRYQVGAPMSGKSTLDKWLTEKYALFQDTPTAINEFEIHHVEWPIFEIGLKDVQVNYPKFNNLLSNKPDLAHYSPGVQVIAWGKKRNKKITGI
ncbi:YqjF family protein [Rufibacter roseus]|uniref:YqjF family protein n=1 Tax=Rufibacter roseus TaxID=1567108 RepID=UPI000AE142A7|nr:DUF2071 domain-containing protein [Rufibacter roseus]